MSSTQIHHQMRNDLSIDLEPPPPSFSTAGDETLPPYTNHLQLASLCRRKREFQAAFDKTPRGRRTWELVWLVLDGTALRVYRPLSLEKKAMENTELGLGLGLGLVRTGSGGSTTSSNIPPPRASAARSPLAFVRQRGRGALLDQQIASGVAAAPLVSASEPQLQLTRPRVAQGLIDSSTPSPSPSSSIEGQARRHRRMDSIAKIAPAAPPAYHSHSVAAPYSSTAFLTTPAPTSGFPHLATTTTTTTTTQPITVALPDFSKRKACRQYHLQHAICTRADTYTKREHVLRFVLADGKQFIVQFSSRAETISWLQLMSIAEPLSLDLDERPMPEPAHYPRRRPRPRPRARASAQRRPSTAPGALGSSTSTSTPITTTTTRGPGSRSSLLAMGGNGTIPPVPSISDNVVDSTVMGEGEEGEDEDNEDDDGDGDDSDGDPLIVEEDMDHLPPPRRPALPRSLSSVEQARRRGIQL